MDRHSIGMKPAIVAWRAVWPERRATCYFPADGIPPELADRHGHQNTSRSEIEHIRIS
ncbi:MAG: hypothetical protein WD802_08140 [Gemmatimonadaceae bacterium]